MSTPENKKYLDEYRNSVNERIEVDPVDGIGGYWDEIGTLQINTLINCGLKPHHTLLDFGCGTLRLGERAIAYLEPGNYTGIDISREAIAVAESKKNLGEFNIFHVDDFNFNKRFDFIMCQSVFTHLPPNFVKREFNKIYLMMHRETKFLFTFKTKKNQIRTHWGSGFAHHYKPGFFKKLAKKSGLEIKKIDYDHPRGQIMMMGEFI